MSPKTTTKKEVKDITITVKALSKTGSVLGEDGVWYSPSKYAKNLPTFEKGQTYALKVQVNGTFNNIQSAKLALDGEAKQSVERGVAEARASNTKPFSLPPKVSGSRDFDKEARGKSRCMLFAAALQSPLAETIDDVLELAEAGMRYTFDDKPVELDNNAGIPTDDGTAYDDNEAATKLDTDENPLDGL